MTASPHALWHHRGFTLTELAIVLVIIGLLLGTLLPTMGAQIDQQQDSETRKALAEAQEALLGFAAANGRLPRPATSATNGGEKSTCADDAACTGFIPWQTLGIKKTDGWNKLIRYSVTPNYANAAFGLGTVATKKIQTRDSSGNLVFQVGSASACSASNACAAAVIYSAGKNNWGTFDGGISAGDSSATNIDEDINENASTLFVTRLPGKTGSPGGEFDDLVTWLPATILFNRMITAGRLP